MNKKTPQSNLTKKANVSTQTSSKRAPKATSKKAAPSQDQIAMRAYFISERRQQMGWVGDHLSDWQEAEQQLLEETK